MMAEQDRDNKPIFEATRARIEAVRQANPDYPAQLVRLMRQISHLHKQIQSQYNVILKPYGLNFTTHNALMMIYGSPEARIRTSELAAATSEKATNITRISDELVAKGLVERKPDAQDRRVIELHLTAQGRALIKRLQASSWQLLERWFAPLDQEQRDALEQLLGRQIEALAAIEPDWHHE